MKFNEKLISLRKSKNLTQQELAKQINYSDKVISKWENGYSFPDMQALISLANFYQISIDDLTNGCRTPELKDRKPFPILPKIFFHILLAFIPIFFITQILRFLFPVQVTDSTSWILAPSWDVILPITLGIILVILTIIDLVFVYKDISRKIIIILIFFLICTLFLLCLIAFIIYGGTTILTMPFVYLILSVVICTAFGFISNRKC